MSRFFIRNRPKTWFLIVIGAIIFLTFQLFSHKALSRSGVFSHHGKSQSEDSSEDQINDDVPSLLESLEERAKQTRSLPRGVHVDDAALYVPDINHDFKCLHSKETIAFKYVNDDYCDCKDGTDEPGTSACPTSRFFCVKQFPDRAAQSVPSSRVNDGICDCCDGSDEWANLEPPESVQVKGKDIVSHAPCKNKCDRIIRINKENEQIRVLGRRLKQGYLEAAKYISGKEVFGPEGVFYKLSTQCYTYKTAEYEYSVCPFQRVRQNKFPSSSKLLGRQPVWKQKSHGQYILHMTHGDSSQCPNAASRKVIMMFLCGINDRVVKIIEEQICEYLVKFATPAAC